MAPRRPRSRMPTRRIGQLNNFALAHLERWVPQLALFKCRPGARRLRGGGDLAAVLDTGARQCADAQSQIVPAGIRDFGDAAASATALATPRSTW